MNLKDNKLAIEAPIVQWEDAIPLGNGLMGGLLYGGGTRLKMSLDRGDLWDERPIPTTDEADFTFRHWLELKEAQCWEEIEKRFDNIFVHPTPTKLPGGRLEITLDPAMTVSEFTLDFEEAVGKAECAGHGGVEVFYSAVEGVALMRIDGPPPMDWHLVAPTVVQEKLGFSDAKTCRSGEARWFVQVIPEGHSYAVVGVMRRTNRHSLLAIAMASSSTDGSDPLAVGLSRAEGALDRGYESCIAPHKEWWRGFWGASQVTIPDAGVQAHYIFARYLLGSGSRTGAPPMPLQGVWTADDGLPPWKGDYHHDLNTQTMYISYLTAGHFDEGRVFLDFMWSLLPAFREFARRFYGTSGAMFPSIMSLAGKPLGGWPMFSLMPQGNASWVGWMFYRHWLYTRDETFLHERAYPFCAELGECLVGLLRPDEKGILRMPMSSSPEIFNNTPKSYLPPNSNYDHDGMVALFGGLAEMATATGRSEESTRWADLTGRVGERWADPRTGVLGFAKEVPFDRSHRHHSHLMAIHPYSQITIEGGEEERCVIEASLAALEQIGVGEWCGYSHTWAACMQARAGQAEAAFKNLAIYVDAFLSRSGFHLNSNQKGGPGWGWKWGFPRLFSLEGNFLAMEAVQEMLLQSWNGVVRVFPAMPAQWADAGFCGLRAEGGFQVTAERKAGRTTRIEVLSTVGGPLRLKSPWADVFVNGARRGADKNAMLKIFTRPGERLVFAGEAP